MLIMFKEQQGGQCGCSRVREAKCVDEVRLLFWVRPKGIGQFEAEE